MDVIFYLQGVSVLQRTPFELSALSEIRIRLWNPRVTIIMRSSTGDSHIRVC